MLQHALQTSRVFFPIFLLLCVMCNVLQQLLVYFQFVFVLFLYLVYVSCQLLWVSPMVNWYIALREKPVLKLRSVTCHMRSHSVYLPPDTCERALP